MISRHERAEFLRYIRENQITRADGEAIMGVVALRWLLAANIVVYNPFNDRLEPGQETQDWYP